MHPFHHSKQRDSNVIFTIAGLELLLVLTVGTALIFGAGHDMLGGWVALIWMALVPVTILGVRHWRGAQDMRTEEDEFEAMINRDTLLSE